MEYKNVLCKVSDLMNNSLLVDEFKKLCDKNKNKQFKGLYNKNDYVAYTIDSVGKILDFIALTDNVVHESKIKLGNNKSIYLTMTDIDRLSEIYLSNMNLIVFTVRELGLSTIIFKN